MDRNVMVVGHFLGLDDGNRSTSSRVAKGTHTGWLLEEILDYLSGGQLDHLIQQWQKHSH